MQVRVLVTGGAGCIGSELARELLRRGAHVTIIDNLSSGKLEHIEPILGDACVRFVEGDLLDRDALDGVVRGIDTVFHLAANPDVKFSPGDPTDKDLQQNTVATYHVLESMRQHGVRRLAFASTSAVYGISAVQPIPEDAQTHPISLYGATKLSCEAMIGAFEHLFDMQCWILRFANIVGPKVRKTGRTVIGDFVARLSKDPTRLRILGNGLQAKSYLLSEECVEAMLFAVEHAPGGVFNLGCSDSLTVNRIAQMAVDTMGLENVRFEYTGGEGGWPGDVPRFLLDVSRINRLGWRARHTSEEAVARALRSTLEKPAREVLCRS